MTTVKYWICKTLEKWLIWLDSHVLLISTMVLLIFSVSASFCLVGYWMHYHFSLTSGNKNWYIISQGRPNDISQSIHLERLSILTIHLLVSNGKSFHSFTHINTIVLQHANTFLGSHRCCLHQRKELNRKLRNNGDHKNNCQDSRANNIHVWSRCLPANHACPSRVYKQIIVKVCKCSERRECQIEYANICGEQPPAWMMLTYIASWHRGWMQSTQEAE